MNVDIPQFIHAITEKDFAGSIRILKGKNALPAVCGRVCPQENQCEKVCILGIKGEPVAIGRLERYVADRAREEGTGQITEGLAPKNGIKVAVVGGGPSCLTAAGDLAKLGYDVTLFEALHKVGGVLMYGIPEFRLPKDIVQHEVQALKDLGVNIMTDVVIGRTFTLHELLNEEGFQAVYVGTGAGLPHFMHIPGEALNGVYAANEFLTRVNLMGAWQFPKKATPVYVGKNVAVVGAGNVAMDAARCARRMGADVHVLYRRGEAELPARLEEIHHAKEEGIQFDFLTAPLVIHGDDTGRVCAVTCQKMQLGEPDASGRRRPVAKEGCTFTLDVDCMVMSIGTSPNPMSYEGTPDLELTKKGCVQADEETGATSVPGLYAGGDAATGAATVILAMGAGKKAAAHMAEYMLNK